jgi:hypothetical protein
VSFTILHSFAGSLAVVNYNQYHDAHFLDALLAVNQLVASSDPHVVSLRPQMVESQYIHNIVHFCVRVID